MFSIFVTDCQPLQPFLTMKEENICSGVLQLNPDELLKLKELLSNRGQRILLLGHTNPDGDAVGSDLALARLCENLGHTVNIIVPNKYPYFLDWMPRIGEVIVHKLEGERCQKIVQDADIIFCVDFNSVERLEALGELVNSNVTAKRILIDHHLSPVGEFYAKFSFPESSSTAFLVYSIIESLYGKQAITLEMAQSLYVGMMTDTGNFSFSFLTPALYRAIATLLECGISPQQLHDSVYNAYSADRARLFGYVIHRKMKFLKRNSVAYMSLEEDEMRRFHFQQGDSEGFVNYPLTVGKMKLSAMFLAHTKFIRVSLRSRGNIDVNIFARKYFNGGGHKNAAGGKSFMTMVETIEHFKRSIDEFASEGYLNM